MSTSKKFTKSIEWLERARKVIPSATQTYSKGHKYYCEGSAPNFYLSAKGSKLFDVDGNAYLDWCMGLGASILGYGARSAYYLDGGTSLPSRKEVELAEKLVDIIPSAQKVRFLKTGSGACAAAVKVARAFTGNRFIISIGYHGWHEMFTPDCAGSQHVKELTIPCKYGDIDHLKALFQTYRSGIAAVIMEPVQYDDPPLGYLEEVRSLCNGIWTLLIFDEVVTGFRLAVQEVIVWLKGFSVFRETVL